MEEGGEITVVGLKEGAGEGLEVGSKRGERLGMPAWGI